MCTLTSILLLGVQSYIHHLPTFVIFDCIGLNCTVIYTICVIIVSMTQVNLLIMTKLIYVTTITIKWQSLFVRKVPVSTVSTLSFITACLQVSVAMYTVFSIRPHLIEVQKVVIGQIFTHEGDIWNLW